MKKNKDQGIIKAEKGIPKKKKRENWLDATRGIAIVVTMYVHFMRWFLDDFQNWNFSTSGDMVSNEVLFVRLIEGYFRIGWIFPFVVSWFFNKKAQNWDLSWYFKRFLLLLVAPSAIWMIYTQSFVFRWEIIQALFIFNVMMGLLIDVKVKYRLILYSLVIGLCVYLMPYRNDLATDSLIWRILVGGSEFNNYFPLLYGMPAFFVIFEVFYHQFRVDPKGIEGTKYVWGLFGGSSIALIGLFLFGNIYPTHYPPAPVEYFASFWLMSVVYLTMKPFRDKVSGKGLLTLIGRYTWVHFMGHLIIGGILFEGYKFLLNSQGFLGANILSISIIIALWLVNLLISYMKGEFHDK